MLKKISDQIYNLKAGQYFNVDFRNYHFRINAVNILKENSVSYNTVIITFDDETHIISKPSDSTKDLVGKFMSKIKDLHGFTENNISHVSEIRKYES